jgi:hypothetical protein
MSNAIGPVITAHGGASQMNGVSSVVTDVDLTGIHRSETRFSRMKGNCSDQIWYLTVARTSQAADDYSIVDALFLPCLPGMLSNGVRTR